MTATVERGTKRISVKNLGWLLRHAAEAEEIHIEHRDYGRASMTVYGTSQADNASNAQAAWVYTCMWESAKLCCVWIKRPSLRHAVLVQS